MRETDRQCMKVRKCVIMSVRMIFNLECVKEVQGLCEGVSKTGRVQKNEDRSDIAS